MKDAFANRCLAVIDKQESLSAIIETATKTHTLIVGIRKRKWRYLRLNTTQKLFIHEFVR